MRIRSPKQRLRGNWKSMIRRCTDPRDPGFKNYGGRGITVCDEWVNFDTFFADMGLPEQGMMLERRDNNGPYSASNCIWAPRKVQNRNKRNIPLFEFNGESLCIAEWAERVGMKASCLYRRVVIMGMPLEEAISKPLRYSVWRRSRQETLK